MAELLDEGLSDLLLESRVLKGVLVVYSDEVGGRERTVCPKSNIVWAFQYPDNRFNGIYDSTIIITYITKA